MKKLLFVFVFALIEITNTYASNANTQVLPIKGMHNTENKNSNRAGNQAIENFSIATGKIAGACKVFTTISSGRAVVTLSATAATCKEAWATLNKVIAPYL